MHFGRRAAALRVLDAFSFVPSLLALRLSKPDPLLRAAPARESARPFLPPACPWFPEPPPTLGPAVSRASCDPRPPVAPEADTSTVTSEISFSGTRYIECRICAVDRTARSGDPGASWGSGGSWGFTGPLGAVRSRSANPRVRGAGAESRGFRGTGKLRCPCESQRGKDLLTSDPWSSGLRGFGSRLKTPASRLQISMFHISFHGSQGRGPPRHPRSLRPKFKKRKAKDREGAQSSQRLSLLPPPKETSTWNFSASSTIFAMPTACSAASSSSSHMVMR